MSEGREDGKASVEDASAPAPEAVSPPAVAVQPDSVQPAESDTPTLLPHMEDGQLVATVSEVLVDPSLPFGAHHGPRIDNYETVLREVDEMLTGKPPAIEYLFVCPFRNKEVFGFGFGSPYGHAAVRYTLPSGQQIVMNIAKNKDNHRLVNFIDPTEYLYGTLFDDVGAEQGGAYNRRIVGVRIENWSDASIMDLDYFYRKMSRKELKRSVSFHLFLGPIYNWLREQTPEAIDFVERGNCARWTSSGLAFADVLKSPHVWPKQIWINLFEKYGLMDRKNVNVVLYEHIKHAHQSFGDGTPLWLESAGPFAWFFDYSYFDLKKYANVIVSVPPGETRAVVSKCEDPVQPSMFRWRKAEILFYTAAAGYVGTRLYKRFTRPKPPPPPPGVITNYVMGRRLMRFFKRK